ncbi:hypothetical protein [Streptomyces sp. MBT53]|uniref:hypothetical protein n=1 Tax=Streptomyces sp. MBT53 TaxID=1488384 RepID=UPI001F44FD94|nr:hypothetical protein [Streptomyces sp. MBT53]
MPSVVGLLEQRELGARRRVDELREAADRIQAELAVAEQEWKERAIARSRVGEVLAPVDESGQDHAPAEGTVPAAGEQTGRTSQVPTAAKPTSQVAVWREGLAWSVLSVGYQRILQVLADRARLRQGALTCQEMAAVIPRGPRLESTRISVSDGEPSRSLSGRTHRPT